MMEREPKRSENANTNAQMCKMKCGFYANPLFGDLCSNCHEQNLRNATFLGAIRGYEIETNCTRLAAFEAMDNRVNEMPCTYENEESFNNSSCSYSECDDDVMYNINTIEENHVIEDNHIIEDNHTIEDNHSIENNHTIEKNHNTEKNHTIDKNHTIESNPIITNIEEDILAPDSPDTQECGETKIVDKIIFENLTSTPSDICSLCTKKLTFSGIKCKCDKYFCFKHRHPETHECTFNFKESGKSLIYKHNPKVMSDKIRKL